MKNDIKGPGDKKNRVKPVVDDRTPEHERQEPAAAERTGDPTTAESPDEGGPSREEIISNVVDPVTNQDEQDKITNAGGDVPTPDK